MVGYEFWLERDTLVLLDFDPDVAGIASQPFWLCWTTADGKLRSHAPDYFARLADGSARVIDYRPTGRIKPRDQAAFEATRDACASSGRYGRRSAVCVGALRHNGGVTPWKDRLSALARNRLPAEVAATWIELFQPGIRLVSSDTGPRVGHLGGNPALPDAMDWPTWARRGPLTFIAAVDCATLPREFVTIPLPDAGTLLFFYFDGRYSADEDQPAIAEDVDGCRVIFVPAGEPVIERTAPAGLAPYPRRDVFAEVVATAPEREHILLDHTETASGVPLAEAVESVLGPGRAGTDVFGELTWEANGDIPQHQVGGFASPVQGAVENEIAAAVLEGEWSDPRLSEEAARWVLLAQFDSDENTDMLWGDVGTLYWLIRTDDLKAGRFDAARCTMQCG
ncbi:TnsA-like heteromeric transposase endonuclease subunit [Amycolatopsis sp. NPDC051071]|uniref:TnsA-like heteromeric transposase endonuclease subunit n=1 Tax=Amycolatopsis sp. NPDC051071 TaxID=3154637 RepID=UPI0034354902